MIDCLIALRALSFGNQVSFISRDAALIALNDAVDAHADDDHKRHEQCWWRLKRRVGRLNDMMVSPDIVRSGVATRRRQHNNE